GVWLDDVGRIRCVARAGDVRGDVVELGDFGAPVKIAFPAPEQIWTAAAERDDEELATAAIIEPALDGGSTADPSAGDRSSPGVAQTAAAGEVQAACELTIGLGS